MSYEQRTLLTPAQIRRLRESRQISAEEYAFIAGDLLVAENVQTAEKRVLGQVADVLNEGSNKRVLKG